MGSISPGRSARPRSAAPIAGSAVCAVVLALAACGCGSASATTRTPEPTAPPTPRPTIEVLFHVGVTPVPTRPARRPRPTPRPTRVVPHRGPFIALSPRTGPPVNTTISVRGGNLPPSFTVQLLWSPWRRTSGISKTAYTDRRGALVSELSVPASPPGAYVVTVTVNGVPYASALYTVRSAAVLSASASFAPGGDVVRVAGKRFVGNLKLELVAYPMFTGRKAVVLGIVTASPSGSFQRSFTTNQLRPGQWVLRAWSISDLAVQMAEAYFEVLI